MANRHHMRRWLRRLRWWGRPARAHHQEELHMAERDRDRFDKFTERARRVLSLAQEEAQRFNHTYIGTEHMLLGLIRERDGVAAKVLGRLGVELDAVRQQVEHIIGRGDRIVLGEIGLTPRAKKVIELAVEEARRMGHRYIGTEHLLLGLVREGDGVASHVLARLGVELDAARQATLDVLREHGGTGEQGGDARAAHFQSAPRQAGSDQDRFDTFTERARRVLTQAQEEAKRFNHNYIGTEHLLLGLAHEGDGVASTVLARLGVELDAARQQVEFIIGRGDRIVLGEIGLTPRAKNCLHLAVEEAQRMGHRYVGTEHLLLGLVREGEGIAAGVLQSLGVRLEAARQVTLDVLRERGGAAD